MFNHRQNLKKLVCGCLLIVGCLVPAISGLAAEAGSIQISYHGRTDDETVVLSDTPFVLYHAGGWGEGGWTLSEDFQGSGVSLENPDSSERKEQAEKLYAYAVKEKLQGREQKTDKAGITKFENLEKGLYLIAQTRKIRKGDLEFHSSPFLVCMPGTENGEEVWELTIEPKSEWNDIGSGGGDSEEGGSGGGSGSGSGGENPGGGSGGGTTVVPGGDPIETSPAEESEPLPSLEEANEIARNGETPKTGDTSLLEIWVVVLTISAAIIGLLGWLIVRIRISEDRDTSYSETDKKTKKR